MANGNATQFVGFDVSGYPGDSTMAWLWTHGFRVSGFYLNHHRGGEDDSWISRRAKLVNAGWGLAPLYLGWQTVDIHGNPLPPPDDPIATAKTDAEEALKLLSKADFPHGSTIFFDIEDGTTPSGNYDVYLASWFGAIRTGNYSPAAYCSHNLIPWVKQKNIPC